MVVVVVGNELELYEDQSMKPRETNPANPNVTHPFRMAA